jgi:hypothetical protein
VIFFQFNIKQYHIMRHIFLLLLLFLLAFAACKQETKTTADGTPPAANPASAATAPTTIAAPATLYVHAANGSVLRKTPDRDGEKIATLIANGRPLQVLAPADPNNRIIVEKIGAFELSGGWVKVKTEAGQEGYLFEGYLAPYPPLIEVPEEGQTYFEAFYAAISSPSGPREALPMQPEAGDAGHRQRFADGAVVESTPYAGGYSETLRLPAGKMTPQEALVVFRPLWFRQGIKSTVKYDNSTSTLTVNDGEGYQDLIIKPKNGGLEIQFSSAD